MIEELKALITKDENLFFFEGEKQFISIFTQKRFDISDYEILSRVQREYLKKSLSKLNFNWVTGSILASKESENRIIFPKYKNIDFFPYKEILTYKNTDIIVISPTQLAYYIIQNQADAGTILKEMIYKLPINIVKLKRLFPQSQELLLELEKEQAFALKNSSLRFKSEIDTTF